MLVMDMRVIMTKYIRSGLLVDFIGFLVYYYDFVFRGDAKYIKILFYIKVYTLVKIDPMVHSKAMYNQYANAFYRFIKRVGLILLLTNFEACVYFSIDYHYYA